MRITPHNSWGLHIDKALHIIEERTKTKLGQREILYTYAGKGEFPGISHKPQKAIGLKLKIRGLKLPFLLSINRVEIQWYQSRLKKT